MSGRCLLLSLECPLHMHVGACTGTHVQRRHRHLLLSPFIPYAQLSFHLTHTAPPHLPTHPPPPPFHNIHGSSIPSAPSPHAHTAHRPLRCPPTSLPDNTTARHPIIFMHTLRTHSYTAVHSALCWQRCLSNVSVLMHSSHVSACYDYSIRTQTAEAGSPQVQRSNKAKGGGSHFYLILTLGGNAFMKSSVTLRQPSLNEACHPYHGQH